MLIKRGQISIFIIIAVVIVAGILAYFVLKGKLIKEEIPARFQPVEEYFLSCIKEQAESGISLLEEQGGYIYVPEFQPGSAYMPSSNQLDFFGSPVAFWYYVSGNNIVTEQMPSKKDMENQLAKYLEENLACDFSDFVRKGYVIDLGEIEASVKISPVKVDVSVSGNLGIKFENESLRVSPHKQGVESKLGKFYDTAVRIYNKEKIDAFLEKYALDVLYLYAPVNGVEITCSPKIWNVENLKKDIKEALEANTLMIKVKGNYYKTSKVEKYFVTDVESDEAVQFLYSKDWPTKINVEPNDNGLMVAEPVGNQPGLGMMGFCYVPYHFVYDLVYPVLIQVYDEREVFRFPVSVVIEGNKERNALPGTFIGEAESEVCRYKNTEVSVFTYNTDLEPVEAEISFKCFNENCDIGKTNIQEGGDAMLIGNFPQCVNGFLIAEAEGYETKKQMISTNQENTANIILNKLYNVSLNFKIDSENTALMYLDSDSNSAVVVWPEQKSVRLAEGFYNISVYVYKNSSVHIEGTKSRKCVEMVKPGLMGVFGSTTEKCFDMEIPSQDVTNVVVGGGRTSQYITENELQKGNADVTVESLPLPKSLEDLQKNYELLEEKSIYLDFK